MHRGISCRHKPVVGELSACAPVSRARDSRNHPMLHLQLLIANIHSDLKSITMMTPEKGVENDPPCHAQACSIQACLQKSNYKEEKCQKQVDALYECCNLFYQKAGDDGSSVEDEATESIHLRLDIEKGKQGAARKKCHVNFAILHSLKSERKLYSSRA
ncbi:DUF1903-domain-containing protein [Dissoconium aciculare CBS 342.82]|uniref:Cx9C motif-containing protein 4, mitochondrial n=1 Tax=Dissoconium aciculare CBS 342.82 TaxID=1314786 RepID=A0A6J3MHM0_9PEZI|nr:DUF1903-domain-containing protein [Dissoconium aciculare CBS 342.82]KAF1826387.1 DUF1903-domain-containing protein [Dissoconium aciculare CBS 342.82]